MEKFHVMVPRTSPKLWGFHSFCLFSTSLLKDAYTPTISSYCSPNSLCFPDSLPQLKSLPLLGIFSLPQPQHTEVYSFMKIKFHCTGGLYLSPQTETVIFTPELEVFHWFLFPLRICLEMEEATCYGGKLWLWFDGDNDKYFWTFTIC